MKTLQLNMKESMPCYLVNWSMYHNALGMQWSQVIEMFHNTTNGCIVGVKGGYEFEIVFDNDQDYTWFILRWYN